MTKQILKDILKKYPKIVETARKLIAFVPLSIRLGKEFWVWYAFFEESEQWNRTQIYEYQITTLHRLLNELSATSNFYKKRLSGININDINTIEEFQVKVPTLSRQEFIDNYSEIRSKLWKKQNLVQSQTSGTTGMALQFYHTAQDAMREWAAICHQWKRVGYDPATSRRAEFRGLTTPGKIVEFFPEQNMIRCSVLHLKAEHLRYYADEIRKAQIGFYHGYPSALYLVAREICISGIDFPQPQAILLASEQVYDWQVDQIKQAFPNAKLFAHYGCAERTVLAGWCETTQIYHILPQYSIFEVDQKTSEVIGTNLFNTVNGFVRYKMTDHILSYHPDVCSHCSRPYTPLVTLCGRTEDYLYSPQNGWIPPAIVTYPLKSLKTIHEIQFLQKKRDEIRVLYTADQKDLIKIKKELAIIKTGLHELFGKDMNIVFEKVETFSRSQSGKYKWIICDLEEKPYSS